jgi:hypothetical protein
VSVEYHTTTVLITDTSVTTWTGTVTTYETETDVETIVYTTTDIITDTLTTVEWETATSTLFSYTVITGTTFDVTTVMVTLTEETIVFSTAIDYITITDSTTITNVYYTTDTWTLTDYETTTDIITVTSSTTVGTCHHTSCSPVTITPWPTPVCKVAPSVVVVKRNVPFWQAKLVCHRLGLKLASLHTVLKSTPQQLLQCTSPALRAWYDSSYYDELLGTVCLAAVAELFPPAGRRLAVTSCSLLLPVICEACGPIVIV